MLDPPLARASYAGRIVNGDVKVWRVEAYNSLSGLHISTLLIPS
jgi:hypothetical protein